ncbi:hypothetical protein VSS37_11495 [Candidatus Thiothrix sp. Deng01]|uniref:Rap1a immunity protein domain-containing protein n=1 Tax=Candidatus Thiothrix phosphatis TaxID=3112415 RepID=A0ABU6CYI9_9GAMM|nr:hypothetical protein [Candidatus Thiothrix sp. Deng01]MEB4591606.1 hypothetical protein [Candidatus Thiothrix sp. Deng01]
MHVKQTVLCAALVGGFAAAIPNGYAASLYFEKTPVNASSEKTCLSFASNVSRDMHFANGHKSPEEVAGETGGAYVAITCVARPSQKATAIVMSVADTFDVAKRVGQDAANRIRKVVCFDSPC